MTTATSLELRPFDPMRDFPPVVELMTAASTHHGVDWFPTVAGLTADWMPKPNYDPSRDTILAFDGQALVGVARTSWREREAAVVHRVEIWVRPDRLRQGIGTRLLEWGENRSREAVADGTGGPRDLPHVFGGGADKANRGSIAFAERAGYVPIRFHYEMRRDLTEPIPEPALIPDGLELRPVTPDQHRRIWLADAEAFRDHWDTSTPFEEDFVQFFQHPDVDTALWLVVWDGDEVAGMVLNAIYPEENEHIGIDIGWIDGVATRRPWRGRGVASALIPRALALLRDRGMAVASLGVDTQNPTGALGLYERFGFKPNRTWAFYRKPF
jgi:mycothiol synthase